MNIKIYSATAEINIRHLSENYILQGERKEMAKGGFKGGMGGMNMAQMVKQAKKMQEDMEKAQNELETKTIETSSGGGAVTVVVNGKKEIDSIKIKPEAVDPDDVEMLEDLIMTAVNEGIRKADEMTTLEMGKITGGFNIPGLF